MSKKPNKKSRTTKKVDQWIDDQDKDSWIDGFLSGKKIQYATDEEWKKELKRRKKEG